LGTNSASSVKCRYFCSKWSLPILLPLCSGFIWYVFFKQVPTKVVFTASVVALVSFGIYYLRITTYMQEVNNPEYQQQL
jgi:hypothetical protein